MLPKNLTSTLVVFLLALPTTPANAQSVKPSEQDCHAARLSITAWQSTWDLLDAALQRDGYVKGIPASVVAADPDLGAALAEVEQQGKDLNPLVHNYAAALKTATELVLKVCGPFK